MSRLIFGKVKNVTPAGTSAYDVTMSLPGGDSETFRTSAGASIAYGIDNSEYRYDVHAFNVTDAGRLRGVDDDATFAVRRVRDAFPMGTTVHTMLTHVSTSGMARRIAVLAADDDGTVRNLSLAVARVLGWKADANRGAVVVSGTGVDMGFHLVYELASKVYGDGCALSQRWI